MNWNNRNNDNYVRPVRQHFPSGLLVKMTEIFTLEKIYKAYTDCRKRKKNKISAIKFELKREENLIVLLRDLVSGRYEISRHICFIVKDPVPREVFAADFRDRIVHHLVCAELKELFEKDFIENSFANREGKGTHRGAQQLREYLKAADAGSFYLKLDIKSFFCSIDKDILFRIIEQKIASANRSVIWKKEIIWLVISGGYA